MDPEGNGEVMTMQLALEYAFDVLTDLFKARVDLRETSIRFGWREPDKKLDGMARSKVTLVPGDTSGKIGKIASAKWPGDRQLSYQSRPIGTLHELMTVYCYAVDTENREVELKQYVAVRDLWDDVYSALWRAFHGQFTVDDLGYTHESNERRFGAEIRALITIQARLDDKFEGFTVETPTKVEGDISIPDDAQPYEVMV